MSKTALLVILRVLMILILSGWLCIWFLKPTEIWTKTWHKAEDVMQTTIFRYNGLSFVAFTFPIMGLAMIGFLSLHLLQRSQQTRTRKLRTSAVAWFNPVMIKTPVGLLSGMDLLAIFSFVLLLAWTFYARISQDYKKLMPIKGLKLNEWEFKFLKVATRFGLLAETCLAFLLLPILRRMAIFQLVDIQLEASVRYHVWIGTLMIFFGTLHGVGILFVWGMKHRIQDKIWMWQKEGRIYLAGEIALITGLIIWTSSLPQVRRKKFAVFYYMHHLYAIFLLFFLFHAGDRHFYWVFPGIFLFALDKLLRVIQSRPTAYLMSARILPCKTIELTIPKDPRLQYTPTSIIFMKIPVISWFQWHPFSITSSSKVDDQTMSVMIKCQGSWTNDLYDLLQQEAGSQETTRRIPVAIEGPYGPTSVDFLRYDNLLLVAGGIGITPFLSILKEMAAAGDRNHCPSKIRLIFAIKTSRSVSLLKSVSSLFLSPSDQQWDLKLKIFLTQEERQKTCSLNDALAEFSQEQTVQLDSARSSCAISKLAYPLYLTIIIGLSSVVFIFCLCVFNYLFLPAQKGLKQKIPSTIIDILLVCSLLIALACSTLVAILLRRGNIGEDTPRETGKQVKALLPCSSEAASFGEENEVHYGIRPNFQDILTQTQREFGGPNVGVLVCGPESMKESLAMACRQQHQLVETSKKRNTYAFRSLNFTL